MSDRYVKCKNPDCPMPIPLLCSNLLDKEWFGNMADPDALHEILSCNHCDHVHDYTQRDVLILDPFRIRTLNSQGELSLAIIEFDCVVDHCGVRVHIHRPTPADIGTPEVGKGYEVWKLIDVHCKRGHLLRSIPDGWWPSHAAMRKR